MKKVLPEDSTVAVHILPYVGQVGIVKTPPDISGSQWVEFSGGTGAIFYPKELDVLP